MSNPDQPRIPCLYVREDGTIQGVGVTDRATLEASIPGLTLLEVAPEEATAVGVDPHAWRVTGGVLMPRAAIPVEVSTSSITADGVSECVISGLPDSCVALLMGAVQVGPVEVSGGSLTLTSSTPGVIEVRITADPLWKPWEGTIHAT